MRIRKSKVIQAPLAQSAIEKDFARRIIGQPRVGEAIFPYVQMHQAGLGPEGRPIGVFLLLGPTGTGKTRTVEALSEVLHGNSKNILKVDCGEFQMEHEVAKLVGAPPGYLGHRETQPMLTQAKLNSVASERSNISIVLFDEIEKAAPSMTRLLLGIFDKATLRLGDNNTVNFERTMIFMTSNLGSLEMKKLMSTRFGFVDQKELCNAGDLNERVRAVGANAAKRYFSPEFLNRIDHTVVFDSLSPESLSAICENLLDELHTLLIRRLGDRGFRVTFTSAAKQLLVKKGTSSDSGARELKRVLQREVVRQLAARLTEGSILPGDVIQINSRDGEFTFRTERPTQDEAVVLDLLAA
jgi:ATP-dependent Clp protease ATP-binding subunit ClpA